MGQQYGANDSGGAGWHSSKPIPLTEQTFKYLQRGQKFPWSSHPEALLTQRELQLYSQLLLIVSVQSHSLCSVSLG